MKSFHAIIFILLVSIPVFSQTELLFTADTTAVDTTLDIDNPIPDSTTKAERPQLLPDHYLFTQRALWGEHGLVRMIPGQDLNEKNRMKEVVWRRYMLKAHRVLGYATLLGMVGQAITGIQLYNGKTTDKGLHEGFAAFTNITYFTSGGLMLFAPPWKSDRAPGYSNAKMHKYLSMVHLGCMIATNALAGSSEKPGAGRDWHRATAYAAFGTFFISTVIIHF